MTQNEFDGMAIRWACALLVLLGSIIGIAKYFVRQKDFDKLQEDVEALEKEQQDSKLLLNELKFTMKNLNKAVDSLNRYLQKTNGQQGPSCPAPMPFMQVDDSQ